ncbi:MAG: exo-alpha-sialidase [Chloroflexi bacterium]|nr:exo-alpha-sialidase [Chloroflexota bacterium]
MKVISPELESAQTGLGVRPYIGALSIRDAIGDVPRLHWGLFYSDSGVPNSHYHVCIVTSSGYLVRVAVGDGGAGIQTIWCQSCEYPGNSNTWPGWSVVATNTIGESPALVEGPDGIIYLFYIGVTGTGIRMRTSSDNGVTWSADAVVASHASGQIKAVAAAYRLADGAVGLFWAWDAGTGGADTDIYYSLLLRSGIWTAKSAWEMTPVYGVNGLAAHYLSDWNLVFTGQGPADSASGVTVYHPGVWAVQMGDGGDRATGAWARTWIRRAFGNSGFRYYAPSLLATSTCYRLSYVEKYRGRDSLIRLHHTYRPLAGFEGKGWLEPVPFDYDGVTGAALTKDTDGQVYLIGPGKGWSGVVGAEMGLTARLERYGVVEGPFSSTLTIDLDNSDGGLARAGQTAGLLALRRGAEVRLSRGYVTTGGYGEAVDLPSFRLEGMEYLRSGEESTLRLHCLGGWQLLQAVRAERAGPYPGESIAGILANLAALAGLSVNWEGSASPESTLVPDWELKPGQVVLEAFRELMGRIPESARVSGSGITFRVLAGTDAADLHLGEGGQPVRQASYRADTPGANHVQVYGKLVTVSGGEPMEQTLFGDAVDFKEMDLVYRRLVKLFDPLATSDAAAAGSAATALAGFQGEAAVGRVVVSPVVNLELWDMVSVTDVAAGLNGSKRRVISIEEEFDAGRAVFEQRVGFGPEAGKSVGVIGG